MTISIRSVVRAVGGAVLPHRVAERTPVDGLADIASVVVVGNPEYTTLVTGAAAELLQRLDDPDDDSSALLSTVFVSDADGPELRAALAHREMSAVLGARLGGEALHATLAALIAEDRAASDRLVAAGMNVLTQLARRGGVTAVIAELAHRIDGWAVLLDAQGQPIASAGAGRLHVSDAVAVALGRPVRVRHDGLQVHPVGSDQDRAGHLVVATRLVGRSRSRDLAAQAAALFDLLLRTHNPSLTEHLGRESLLDILLAGGPAAAELLRRWDVHEPSLTAFALGAKTRTVDLERLTRRWLDELGAEHVFTAGPGRVRGFVRDDLVPELAARAADFSPVGGSGVHLGLGAPAPVEGLSRSAVQASQALDTALEEGQRVLPYASLPSVELVLSSLAGAAGEGLSGLLDPLREGSGSHGELTRTLRVFLAEHGAHRASAARLGIHRQTLVSRIRRIEALTGLAMEHPDDRATAWLALRAAGL